MSKIEHDNDASPADFVAGWDKYLHELMPIVGFAVMGLTNLGEHPVQSTRMAEVLAAPRVRPRRWHRDTARLETRLRTRSPS
jgi:hypothetical protein